jgi:hypothetical protein
MLEVRVVKRDYFQDGKAASRCPCARKSKTPDSTSQ